MAGNVEAGKVRKRHTWHERFWGQMAPCNRRLRVAALIFVLSSIVSMSFTQLGFWSIGIIDGKSVYLLLLLGPLAMGAFLFGPLMGGILGLFAGAVVYSHALFMPLDYYEVYFMTTLNTFVLLTAVGAIAGALFNLIVNRLPRGAKRTVAIAGACLGLSFFASIFVQISTIFSWGGLEYIDEIGELLLNSPAGVVVQALIDAAGIILLCLICDAVVRGFSIRGSERRLLGVFRAWMIVVSLIVFMLASAILFTVTTWYASADAGVDMLGEADYLVDQLNREGRADHGALLYGYEVPVDGWVAIVDEKDIILASNDENLPVGKSFLAQIGYGSYDENPEMIEFFYQGIIEYEGGVTIVQAMDSDGVMTMDADYLATAAYDDGDTDKGYVVIIRSSDMVFTLRFGIMAAVTLLAIVLIAAVALLASRLLNHVVVQRIDETNTSLEKITDGDLNERVQVRDSREFTSLSNGINTTVAALKGTITEVEQKNAQDLATSKAIQESALPREFPPFPDIDRFDIYASMKTAKEVGGDFYNFFLIDDRHLGFLIADVSGKGIPAALFMMTAKTQIQNYMEAGLAVGEAVNAANHQLCIGNDAGMFVTAFICILDFETGQLSYVNAGHNPPLIHRGQTWEWVRDVSGMPLGLFDGIPYDEYAMQLQKDDVLFLYTDGVTEAMSAEAELFGEDRLEDVLGKFAGMNPRSISLGVRHALTDYTVGAEQSDDITMLCLKYGVPPEMNALMVLPAEDTQLVHVYNFIHEELHRRNAPKAVYNPIDIATEEMFVNVCRYAYPDATPEDPGEVRIVFEYEANPPSISVTISDNGIPYDPFVHLAATEAKMSDLDNLELDDFDDESMGGLGIFMAHESVDEMTYERVDGSNILTFRKGW